MTICIATIAERNTGLPKIIVASDRLATNKDGLTFQIGIPKIITLISNCAVMISGDSSRGDDIIWKVTDRLVEVTKGNMENTEDIKMDYIAQLFKEEFQKARNEAIETDIFVSRGLTSKNFYKNMKDYPDWFSLIVSNSAENYDFGVEFLVFGFDLFKQYNTGVAHIYHFSGNGEPQILDLEGFGIIGIGARQSLPEITKRQHSPDSPLTESVVSTYLAKKSAERMVGVGSYTDFAIFWVDVDTETKKIKSKNAFISDDIKNILDRGIEEQKTKLQEITKHLEEDIGKIFTGKPIVSEQNPKEDDVPTTEGILDELRNEKDETTS